MEGMRSGVRASEGIHTNNEIQFAIQSRAERREVDVLVEQSYERRS